LGKWVTFAKERFKPLEYLPLIVLFVTANYLFAKRVSGGLELPPIGLLFIGIATFCFFFRMRLFDEIKDYEIDLKINPHRPLARGLISVREVKRTIIGLIILELILISNLGLVPFFLYLFALFYSLLMYEEFFIGDWLRPHLTTYAVSHTIVVAFLSFAIISCVLEFTALNFSWNVFLFCFSHWCIFNLFEFARKTFAANEERPNVPSYSNIFSLKGAYLLSASQVILSAIALYLIKDSVGTGPMVFLAALYCVGLVLTLKNPPKFRNISTFYLVGYFVLLIYFLRSY
jgi:4-hydroxybenzoate polyprenyltransferase